MQRKTKSERRTIASYVGPRSLAPQTRAALRGLGYELVPAFTMGRFDDASWHPALRLVDERQIERIPSRDVDPDTPVILLSGVRHAETDDPRVLGQIQRPAELADLYPLIQRALERTPRQAPRAPTLLSGRCIRSDRRWVGSVLSLSEGGCLFKTSQPIDAGEAMNLQFALPQNGILSARAVCVYRREGAMGLAFSDTPAEIRRRISSFVTRRLATL